MDDTMSKITKKQRVFIESPEGAGYFCVFFGHEGSKIAKKQQILLLFTVIPRSWAVFVQAWKADFVAICGNPTILGHLRVSLQADFVAIYGNPAIFGRLRASLQAYFVAFYGNPAILGHLRAGLDGRFCRYLP